MTHRAILCRSCAPGSTLWDDLPGGLPGFTVSETDCMSGCARPCNVAFRAPGKTAYLFGGLSVEDLGDVTQFGRLYLDSPDGNFPDARVLGGLRLKAIARIPG